MRIGGGQEWEIRTQCNYTTDDSGVLKPVVAGTDLAESIQLVTYTEILHRVGSGIHNHAISNELHVRCDPGGFWRTRAFRGIETSVHPYPDGIARGHQLYPVGVGATI